MATNANHPPETAGVLLVGHGTRDADGQAAFLALARRVSAQLPGQHVAPCFLELAEPTIDAAMAAGTRRACGSGPSCPCCCSLRDMRDLPEQAQAAAERCGVTIERQTDVLGWEPHLLELSALRHRQALAGREAVSPDDTLVLWVARGSRDPNCLANLQRFAEARRQVMPLSREQFAFVSVAAPRLEAVLPQVGQLAVRRVVVQSHFLFPGQLPAQVADRVRNLAATDPRREWLCADVLGDHDLLAAAVVARIHAPRD